MSGYITYACGCQTSGDILRRHNAHTGICSACRRERRRKARKKGYRSEVSRLGPRDDGDGTRNRGRSYADSEHAHANRTQNPVPDTRTCPELESYLRHRERTRGAILDPRTEPASSSSHERPQSGSQMPLSASASDSEGRRHRSRSRSAPANTGDGDCADRRDREGTWWRPRFIRDVWNTIWPLGELYQRFL
ncbi:hypothetical protein MAP00_001015 [Monascus purpureus]|nr:hypothetical protein MAP00_001015 [Monascus purpureus]